MSRANTQQAAIDNVKGMMIDAGNLVDGEGDTIQPKDQPQHSANARQQQQQNNQQVDDKGDQQVAPPDGGQPVQNLDEVQVARLTELENKVEDNEQLSEEEQQELETLQATASQSPDGGGDDDYDGDGTFTPTELADAIGFDKSEVYDALMVPLDDGQDPVSLGELKNSYQNMNRDHQALQTEVEQLRNEAAQATSGFQQHQQVSMEMMQAAGYLQQIDRMEKSTNWQELEDMNPAEAVLKRQKFADARRDTQQYMQQLQVKESQQRQAVLTKSGERMIELIPDWKDAEVKKADQGIIRETMQGFGFADTEINVIADPRVMHMLKEFIGMKKMIDEGKKAGRRVRGAPSKVLRNAQGRFTRRQDKSAVAGNLVDKAKQTGNIKDKVAAVGALLNGRKRG